MLVQFEVRYPDEELVRVAIRGAAAYRLSWCDAHMWAYAERFGIATLWSEDFEDGRLYGRVRARDPFVPSALTADARRGMSVTGGKPRWQETGGFRAVLRLCHQQVVVRPLDFQGFFEVSAPRD